MVGFAIALPTLPFTHATLACYILPMLRLLSIIHEWLIIGWRQQKDIASLLGCSAAILYIFLNL